MQKFFYGDRKQIGSLLFDRFFKNFSLKQNLQKRYTILKEKHTKMLFLLTFCAADSFVVVAFNCLEKREKKILLFFFSWADVLCCIL